MRILIAAVGRFRRGPEQELFESYRKRLSWPLTLREVTLRQSLPEARAVEEEGRLLIDSLDPRGDSVAVALDGGGRSIDSTGLATLLGDWRDSGRGAGFVIGGAYGLSQSVRERAELVLSLGAMTWPHMLVRVMLAEQLYRSQQILAGHPYHHG